MSEDETIYDHMGGSEALRRLMHVFYGKVRLDPELQPLFAAMPDDHPDHVALWLGEVFGGPGRLQRDARRLPEHGARAHQP